jgi:hypothetical protein
MGPSVSEALIAGAQPRFLCTGLALFLAASVAAIPLNGKTGEGKPPGKSKGYRIDRHRKMTREESCASMPPVPPGDEEDFFRGIPDASSARKSLNDITRSRPLTPRPRAPTTRSLQTVPRAAQLRPRCRDGERRAGCGLRVRPPRRRTRVLRGHGTFLLPRAPCVPVPQRRRAALLGSSRNFDTPRGSGRFSRVPPLQVVKDAVDVLLAFPKSRALSMVSPVAFDAPLAEDVLPNDATSDTPWRNLTFLAFSGSGCHPCTQTAPAPARAPVHPRGRFLRCMCAAAWWRRSWCTATSAIPTTLRRSRR